MTGVNSKRDAEKSANIRKDDIQRKDGSGHNQASIEVHTDITGKLRKRTITYFHCVNFIEYNFQAQII